MGLQNTRENKTFASILADGKFHVTVTQDTEGAVLRKWKLKDGTEGEKWELVYDTLEGIITSIYFRDGDYGNQLHIVIEGVDLSMGVDSNFATDFMRKLPSVKIEENVTLKGYSFEDKETKKPKRGITVLQNEEKIQNYFYDADKKKALHDFPSFTATEAKKFDTDDWKMHFMKVRKFLVAHTTKNHLIEAEKTAQETRADKDFDAADTKPEESMEESAGKEIEK